MIEMYFVSWYLHNKDNDGWAYKIEGKYANLDAAKKAYYGVLANYVGSSVYDSVSVMLTDSLGNRVMSDFWLAPQPDEEGE